MALQTWGASSAAKNGGIKALVFCFLIVNIGTMTGCFSQKNAVLKKTVLTVNGQNVSAQEFAERLALRLKNFDSLYAKDQSNLDRAKEDTVRTFILEAISRDYAERQGLKVTEDEVTSEMNLIRSRYPDDLAFRKALAEENLPLEKWKEDLKFSLLQKKIFAKIVADRPEPSDQELKLYYEQNKSEFQHPARVRLRQIVLEKEDDAKRILDELARGGDLEKLAREFSVAPERESGGDTGWIEEGTLEVFDQAFKMRVGNRSKILKSPYGYHIYEVIQKQPEGRLSFEQAKDRIRAHLKERSEQTAFSAWLEEQVRKASVRRNDALIQAIEVTTRGT